MKIFLDSYGCTLNQADALIIKGILNNETFTDLKKAETVIVNSCGVKLTTENKIISTIKKYKKMGKKVIVTGCLPAISPKKLKELEIITVDTNSLEKLPAALKMNPPFSFSSDKHSNKLLLQHCQDDSFTGIIEISEGCLGKCAFCATKNARGSLTSYPVKDIVEYAEKLINSGKKELLITSQDTGAYGKDINSNLPELVNKISKINEEFMIRIGMTNPHFVFNDLNNFIKMLQNRKVYKFIHIPIQSGSDNILKLMNRVGTVSQFSKIISEMRKKVKGIRIATDIIVGFPGETDADFRKTVELMEKTKIEVMNISRYTPRPNTEAQKQRQISTKIAKNRSEILSKLCNELNEADSKKYLNKKIKVLVIGKTKDNRILARTINYKQVILDKKIDDFANALITGYGKTYLKAIIEQGL